MTRSANNNQKRTFEASALSAPVARVRPVQNRPGDDPNQPVEPEAAPGPRGSLRHPTEIKPSVIMQIIEFIKEL